MGRNVTFVGQEKKEDKKELKKHAATIHCSNTLSLLQRKISNALLYHAYHELMLKNEHEITIKQLCKLIAYQGHNHAAIKEALKGLISTVVEWNLIDNETGNENWTASSIIASVSLEGPLCYYAYSPRMKQLLHTPSMFGKIDLVTQSRFRSSYGLALYENCIRYRGLPHTKWLDMDMFKKLMGIPENKYEIFRDLKRRVLDKAVDEVNTYSDLIITPELVREGRKAVKIRFALKERAKKSRLGAQAAVKLAAPELGIKEILVTNFGLSTEQVEQLLSEYEEAFIQTKINVVEASKPYQEGKIENLAGYLLSAIKNNYQLAKTKSSTLATQEKKHEHEMAELKRQIEEMRLDYHTYREQTIHATIDALPPTERDTFMQKFMHFAEPAIHTVLQLQRNKYSRDTVIESPQIKAMLRQFALREFDFISLPAWEDYVNELGGVKRDAWQKLKSYDPEHPLLQFRE